MDAILSRAHVAHDRYNLIVSKILNEEPFQPSDVAAIMLRCVRVGLGANIPASLVS